MRCEKLEIVNFCQHRNRSVSFEEGLTAILGPNGSGKSNFLGAMRFALTGDNPNVGTKAANIAELAPKSEQSYVSLTFSHAGVRAVVRRNLRPSKPIATLQIEGQEEIEGDREVTDRINSILGITSDIVNDIVIVAQDEIFGFLDKTPAKRAEQFQRLFNTAKATLLHNIIGDQLKTVEIPVVVADIDVLRTALSQSRQRLQGLETQLSQFPSYEVLQKNRDDNRAVIDVVNSRETKQRSIDDLNNRISGVVQTVQQQTELRESQHAQLEQLIALRDGKKQDVEAATLALKQLADHQRQAASRRKAIESLEQANQTLAQLVEPVRPDDYVEPSTVLSRLSELQQETRTLNDFITAHSVKGGVCPTCGSSLENLHAQLSEKQQQVSQRQEEFSRLQQQQQRSLAYDNALRDYNDKFSKASFSVQNSQDYLNALPTITASAVEDEAALQKVLEDANQRESTISDYQRLLTQNTETLGRYEGQKAAMQQQFETLLAELQSLPVYTAEQKQQALDNVKSCEQATIQRRQLDEAIAIERETIRQKTEQLAQTEEARRQSVVLRKWHEIGGAMRDVVHKDAAPKFVAQRNLEKLQHVMNEHLEMFGTDYRVSADAGLSFKATFTNGVVQPAERLSEGQKVVLALAFRLALNFMFASDIGALYLDEPTAYLDEHHIRGFEPVLSRLKEYSTSRGLQCMIITHERDLAPLFDSVIQL